MIFAISIIFLFWFESFTKKVNQINGVIIVVILIIFPKRSFYKINYEFSF